MGATQRWVVNASHWESLGMILIRLVASRTAANSCSGGPGRCRTCYRAYHLTYGRKWRKTASGRASLGDFVPSERYKKRQKEWLAK